MKKKLVSLMMLAMAVCGLHAQGMVEVKYHGTTAEVNVPDDVQGVTYSVSGANVVISSTTTTTEYIYNVSGSSDDGSLTIYGSYKFTLRLDGVQLTNAHGGAAIDVECGKRVAVELVEGTVSSLADSPMGAQKAALYFKGHPEFKLSGTLNVTGRLKHAICAKEYMELKSSTGCINILGAVSDGIHCGKGNPGDGNNYFLMDGGTVDIANVGSDGIDTDDYGTIRINGGALSLNVGDAATALKADSIVAVTGGTVNVSVTGDDSEGIRARYSVDISGGDIHVMVTGKGSKAIKGKRISELSTVLNGGFVNISGGVTNIYALGDGMIDAMGDTLRCGGIYVDADLKQTAGEVNIVAMGMETTPIKVDGGDTWTGGSRNIVRTPWHTNAFDYQYDMTVYAVVEKNGERVDDYSNMAVGAFIGDECVGYAVFETADYGIMRVRSLTAESQEVNFKVFDYDTMREYEANADRDVAFMSMGNVGAPSQPVVLNYRPRGLLGDVNVDGVVDVNDVMMIVEYILGYENENFHIENADLDDNQSIGVNDVTLVVAIILD